TEDVVNYTRSVANCEIGVILIEQAEGGVKVSFRSREAVDVAKLAERFGGGGHRLAAGATLPGPLAAARDCVVAAALEALAGAGAATEGRRQQPDWSTNGAD